MGNRGGQILRQWRVMRVLEQARRGLRVAEVHALVADAAGVRTVYRDLRGRAPASR